MIDVLYVAFNRLRYTQASFTALVQNTEWSEVAELFIADDGSIDGTRQWLEDELSDWDELPPVVAEAVFLPAPFGGPVAAANLYLEHAAPNRRRTPPVEIFAKVDNDTIVCPGWLPEMLRLMDLHPQVDLLGMAPRHGPPQPGAFIGRGIELAPFVDGNGLWRRRAFEGRDRPIPAGGGGRFGMTEWQEQHPELTKAWATPDLPVFQLDGLPFEPWLSVAAEYVQAGWQRYWPPFSPDATLYWAWWLEPVGL